MTPLPAETVAALSSAAIITLQELLQIEAVAENEASEADLTMDGPLVIATIELLRDPPGSLSLILSSDDAFNLASRYLPSGTALTPDLVNDVAGEFANVIAGQLKTMLKGTPYHFSLSTPSTAQADAISQHRSCDPCTKVRLISEIGVMTLYAIVPA